MRLGRFLRKSQRYTTNMELTSSFSQQLFTLDNQDYHYQSFLPATLEELEGLDEGDLLFQEVTTRSPRLCHVRHTMLPVFLVSGLGVQYVQPLLHQLTYPAFVTTLPTTSQHSVEEYTELLMLVT